MVFADLEQVLEPISPRRERHKKNKGNRNVLVGLSFSLEENDWMTLPVFLRHEVAESSYFSASARPPIALAEVLGVPVVDRQLLFGDQRHCLVEGRWFPEEGDAKGFFKISSHFSPHLLEGSVPEGAITQGSACS